MKRKSAHRSFNQTLELLRSHSFAIAPYPGIASGVMVSKNGAAAVVVPAALAGNADDATLAFAVHPGIVVGSGIARLVDRGYQKFLRTAQYEFPASAAQLQASHCFSEELKQLAGAVSLYNESLGTTSDLYLYDRLKGRETEQPEPPQPWALTEGH